MEDDQDEVHVLLSYLHPLTKVATFPETELPLPTGISADRIQDTGAGAGA